MVYVIDIWQLKGVILDDCFEIVLVIECQMVFFSDIKIFQGVLVRVLLLVSDSNVLLNVNECCIYLYEIQDFGNLGIILCLLVWFGGF